MYDCGSAELAGNELAGGPENFKIAGDTADEEMIVDEDSGNIGTVNDQVRKDTRS